MTGPRPAPRQAAGQGALAEGPRLAGRGTSSPYHDTLGTGQRRRRAGGSCRRPRRQGEAAVTASAWEAGTRERFPLRARLALALVLRPDRPRLRRARPTTAALPRWWPQAYSPRQARSRAGDDAGRRPRARRSPPSRAPSPTSSLRRLESARRLERPRLIRLKASGQLVGLSSEAADLRKPAAQTRARFAYMARGAPSTRCCRRPGVSSLLKPLFALNQTTGSCVRAREGMKRELARRFVTYFARRDSFPLVVPWWGSFALQPRARHVRGVTLVRDSTPRL